MPVTVKFDPSSTQQQAAIIPDASAKNDGVMTKQQAQQLAALASTLIVTVVQDSPAIIFTALATPFFAGGTDLVIDDIPHAGYNRLRMSVKYIDFDDTIGAFVLQGSVYAYQQSVPVPIEVDANGYWVLDGTLDVRVGSDSVAMVLAGTPPITAVPGVWKAVFTLEFAKGA
jgi:hypothetical protein